MSTFSIVCWTFAIAFQIGYSYRARAEARAGRIKSQAEIVGEKLLDAAEQIETQRQFIGGGDIVITYSATLESRTGREYPLIITDRISANAAP